MKYTSILLEMQSTCKLSFVQNFAKYESSLYKTLYVRVTMVLVSRTTRPSRSGLAPAAEKVLLMSTQQLPALRSSACLSIYTDTHGDSLHITHL